jgi:hypothetical protein
VEGVNPHDNPEVNPKVIADAGTLASTMIAERITRSIFPEPDFDWGADDSIILKEQRATAVYFNKCGEVIIRQQATWDQQDDTFIAITAENANAFMDGLADRIRKG